MVIRQGSVHVDSIEKEDVGSFDAPLGDIDEVSEIIIPRQRLKIRSLNFNKDGKWRLTDGEKVRWYAMADREFINSVQEGERFGIGDILLCEVVMLQRTDPLGNLQLDYEVRRVLRHVLPGEQLSIF